jgi:T-complex protein 1 subunit zeta
MPKRMKNCFILTCNVSLEYEKTEVHSGFFYSTADEREKLALSERKFTDERCQKIIDLKREVCKEGQSFAIINQKGIDPICLEMMAKEGIVGIRRAKRRNMERLVKAFGGNAVNSVEDLSAKDLGWCETLYEHNLTDDKYTFLEGAKNPTSCTILIKGPNEHTIA